MLSTQAIVIRAVNYKDYDKIITLFSPEHGRMEALLKGCRKQTAALKSAGEIFCAGLFSYVEKNLRKTITGCTVKENFYALRRDLDALNHACLYVSICEKIVQPGQEAHELFHELLKSLAALTVGTMQYETISASFMMKALVFSGFAPDFSNCAACGKAADNYFSTQLAGCVCDECVIEKQKISDSIHVLLHDLAHEELPDLYLSRSQADTCCAILLESIQNVFEFKAKQTFGFMKR